MTILDIETIAAWPADEALCRALREEAGDRRFPVEPDAFLTLCPLFARIVCVGVYRIGESKTTILYDGSLLTVEPHPELEGIACTPYPNEPALLAALSLMHVVPQPLVTFNGRNYDLACIWHRSKIHGITPSPLITAALHQKPWEHRPHVDLAQLGRFGGAMRWYSLRMFSIAYGLGDPKADYHGGDVSALVAARNGTDLLRYNLRDLRATAGLAGYLIEPIQSPVKPQHELFV